MSIGLTVLSKLLYGVLDAKSYDWLDLPDCSDPSQGVLVYLPLCSPLKPVIGTYIRKRVHAFFIRNFFLFQVSNRSWRGKIPIIFHRQRKFLEIKTHGKPLKL